MRKNRKFLLLFTLSLMLAFQMAAAHSYYDSLIEADFFCKGLKFEAADLETLFVDKQTHLVVEMNTASCILPDLQIMEARLPLGRPASSCTPDASILRC